MQRSTAVLCSNDALTGAACRFVQDRPQTVCRQPHRQCLKPFAPSAACPPGRFTATLVLFVLLMGFVLAEYRKLPYTPFRCVTLLLHPYAAMLQAGSGCVGGRL